MNDHDTTISGLGNSGHLSTLGLEAYVAGDLDASACAAVDAHLATCGSCRGWVAEVREQEAARQPNAAFLAKLTGLDTEDDGVLGPGSGPVRPLAPVALDTEDAGALGPGSGPVRPSAPVSLDEARVKRSGRWVGAVMALAAAAVLLIALGPFAGSEQPASEPDGVRTKGPSFELEVYVRDGASTRLIDSRDTIHPGDEVGFRVRAARRGYLGIIGVDQRGSSYVAFPAGAIPDAVAIEVSESLATLDAAIGFDAVLGHERLVALMCDESFPVADAEARLAASAPGLGATAGLPQLLEGCTQRELILFKTAESP